MSKGKKPAGAPKKVEALRHEQAKRKNIPTAELQSVAQRAEEIAPFAPVTYPRRHPLAQGETRPRDKDLDPQMVWKGTRVRLTAEQIKKAAETGYVDISDAQLVWRGKDQQDWSDLVVHAPPLYIQEKVHPKAIIDDLTRRAKEKREAESDAPDLFHDFNGIDPEAKTEFYAHDQNWSNRFILGDSLQVMASLAEREGLRGQVQCIYFDPPYGIKFNSNWQVSTRSRDVKDGKIEEISREPEQVRAFRDTWKDGIHSYLTYLRDRLTAMRDLLNESGSIFVQISDENVHRVRGLLDEVFGPENFVSQIIFSKTAGATSQYLPGTYDIILFYAKHREALKFRAPKQYKQLDGAGGSAYTRLRLDDLSSRSLSAQEKAGVDKLPEAARIYRIDNLTSQSIGRQKGEGAASWFPVEFQGRTLRPSEKVRWKTNEQGMKRLKLAGRLEATQSGLYYVRYFDDFPVFPESDMWTDTGIAGFASDKTYVVETSPKVVERCLLMATDPGDLVLDPTCGSGTTATVAEQWGRRWITVDTSRVALALARARVIGARYPYYHLADSKEGRLKEGELSGKPPVPGSSNGDLRQGFVYERAPHITLKSIANNAEIEVVWTEFQEKLEPIRRELNSALGENWEEWEIPRTAVAAWSDNVKGLHQAWWELRVARQRSIDQSIFKRAEVEHLYDRPIEDKGRVRVAGPFTVESLSPHRVAQSSDIEPVDLIEPASGKSKRKLPKGTDELSDFTTMILEHLKTSGVQQAKKDDRIGFTAITGWPGDYIAGDGRFMEGETEKRAAIFIGPEFGTVSRADLTAAAREALDARFDALIACGFNFEAHTSELNKLGPLPILKAKMNPELHMSDELKNTGAGNMFVVFGEPDIKWDFNDDGDVVVEVLGVDVFDPKTGDVRASGKEDIAAWFIDTDYDETSFFVRHAYFMGANDPYKSLKAALKAEIDEDAWATLYRDKSRPFARPETGRFAVKVINHFGDEVMKVFAV
ncbi:MAG: site-specific DNA-methyltransferase [Mesorhizobium sp.]|uniref:site-specific DNA-methyltransferase n=1 Tax=Mesorhizobium sp. TaxID=1871066 RepID=UPI000FE9DE99|nr:site-specific DNA-methyltransferase [Mesorhizobium sp.]RWJ39754.1 MAG: site-specific DNA-methyltransferase [Mesorhizobium sp.]RWJ81392.1 MAG: site-specific DNA-methyltransferase [Mesorhizobium sp.]TIR08903.1 MAG: site-specific DNA-methyltransferase [Mesorhizobium sp.]